MNDGDSQAGGGGGNSNDEDSERKKDEDVNDVITVLSKAHSPEGRTEEDLDVLVAAMRRRGALFRTMPQVALEDLCQFITLRRYEEGQVIWFRMNIIDRDVFDDATALQVIMVQGQPLPTPTLTPPLTPTPQVIVVQDEYSEEYVHLLSGTVHVILTLSLTLTLTLTRTEVYTSKP